jgi:hypothetical protein
MKLETNQEKKQYILSHWNLSSGSRISEMLKRYWSHLKEKEATTQEKLIKSAEDIFKQ